MLHIADATAEKIVGKELKKVALLGTKFTMNEDFYKARLKEKFDIDVIVPESEDNEFIHSSIADELAKGEIKETTKKKYIEIMDKLIAEGAEGVILGCTEIPLLIKQKDVSVPVFDTTEIHAKAAVDFALKD